MLAGLAHDNGEGMGDTNRKNKKGSLIAIALRILTEKLKFGKLKFWKEFL